MSKLPTDKRIDELADQAMSDWRRLSKGGRPTAPLGAVRFFGGQLRKKVQMHPRKWVAVKTGFTTKMDRSHPADEAVIIAPSESNSSDIRLLASHDRLVAKIHAIARSFGVDPTGLSTTEVTERTAIAASRFFHGHG